MLLNVHHRVYHLHFMHSLAFIAYMIKVRSADRTHIVGGAMVVQPPYRRLPWVGTLACPPPLGFLGFKLIAYIWQ